MGKPASVVQKRVGPAMRATHRDGFQESLQPTVGNSWVWDGGSAFAYHMQYSGGSKLPVRRAVLTLRGHSSLRDVCRLACMH